MSHLSGSLQVKPPVIADVKAPHPLLQRSTIMDLDDLDELAGLIRPAQRTTAKFAPRSSKLAPKPKAIPKPKPDPSVKPEPQANEFSAPVIQKKEEDDVEGKPPVLAEPESENGAAKMEIDVKGENGMGEDERGGGLGEVDDEEDAVVSEIDVFFKPSVDPNAKIYVLQYPLRPCWRPYELDDRCEEVRLKPGSSQMELDLLINKDSKNFDPRVANDLKFDKVEKQTLHTKWETEQVSRYTVGILMGNKIHLSPVHAVVQLRPSLDHFVSGSSSDASGTKRKNVARPNVEVAVKAEGAAKQSKVKQEGEGEEEDWVALKFHGSRSDVSEEYLKKMVAGNDLPLQFNMSPSDFLDSLCPLSATNAKDKSLLRKLLLDMPVEERVKKLLCEGPPFKRFNVLKHYAPDTSDEDLLEVLELHAGLVQGLWVGKSSSVMPGDLKARSGRNYVLLMFSKSPFMSFERLNSAGRHKDAAKEFLKVVAVERGTFKDWKLREEPDTSFENRFPEIVKKQRRLWEQREEMILKDVRPVARVVAGRGVNRK